MTMQTQKIELSVFVPGAQGTVMGFAPGHELSSFVPKPTTGYQFPKTALRDMFAFLGRADGDGLFLSGPTGCGKTSLILEVAARLNWPVRRVNGHARLEVHELIGSMSLAPVKGGGAATRFQHGPLAMAMREGSIFILDEIDLLDPAISAGLNAILEGNPLVIAENGGEVIVPHPNFRFIATGNTAGLGDDTGAYAGTVTQNLAYMDRFWVVQVGYPTQDVEEQILEARFSGLLDQRIATSMVRVANAVREQFIGTGNAGATLSITFSTRTLIRWAQILLHISRSPIEGSKLEYALDRALTMRARPHEREAIVQIGRSIFGSAWT
ncbi:AAA family ATPase [Allochromatium humboldtianum]|uniref:AAA family ATPase n=1 Tax=Allochromatium humboldtianum TaxID=504901 RepID=A0A850RLK6_9GAMM|nr:AAA family ATPase [Allochromatium humboldtianum]NVZ11760.1 AAA family ATPase [Allochromatium humboldtianum]